MKSKLELLEERLDRFKKNSQAMIERMDKKVEAMSDLKDDINNQTEKLNKWEKDYQSVLTVMAERMLGINITNHPLRQPTDPKKARPEVKSVSDVVERMMLAEQICILTGAGVSKKSGIPTFRAEDGLYNREFRNMKNEKVSPEQFLTLKNFNESPELIWNWYGEFQDLLVGKNPCDNHFLIHRIASILGEKGKEVTIVTTNIDNFHSQVSDHSNSYKIEEIHGNIKFKQCQKCNHRMMASRGKFFCEECKCTYCRPNIMFFDEKYGQVFGKQVKDKKFKFTICIGTSLETGLSLKIVCQAEQVVEINPKCVIKSGRVYRFEEDCTDVLRKILSQIEEK